MKIHLFWIVGGLCLMVLGFFAIRLLGPLFQEPYRRAPGIQDIREASKLKPAPSQLHGRSAAKGQNSLHLHTFGQKLASPSPGSSNCNNAGSDDALDNHSDDTSLDHSGPNDSRDILEAYNALAIPDPDDALEEDFSLDKALSEDAHYFPGIILTGESIDLAPAFSGTVIQINVKLGDFIKRGAIVARFDPVTLPQDLTMARSMLKASKAKLEKIRVEKKEAEEKWERRKKIAKNLSQEEVASAAYKAEALAHKYKVAQSDIAEKQAFLSQVRKKLSTMALRAPFSGVVAMRYIDPGSMVEIGQPIIRLTSQRGFRVRFAVPPEKSSHAFLGQKIRIFIDSLKIHFPGTIIHVAQEVDEATGMIFTEGDMQISERSKPLLKGGLVAHVSIEKG